MYDDKITNDRVQAAPSSFHRGGLRRLGKDALLDEPLHTEEPRKKLPLVQGSVDMTFLLIVVALVLYGIIMAYSCFEQIVVSREYIEQELKEKKEQLEAVLKDGKKIHPGQSERKMQ
jgi:hypothetical protein